MVTKKGEWLDLCDANFILLKHGANVFAVDLDRDFIWKKLFAAVAQSRGSLFLPVRDDADPASLSWEDLERESGSTC